MTVFTQSAEFEAAAIAVVSLGRQLAGEWPGVAVEHTPALHRLAPDLMRQLTEGDAFASANEQPLALMLAAICRTLDGYSPGYGERFLSEATGSMPFLDREREQVRRFGELLKAFDKARRRVIDTVVAERRIAELWQEELGDPRQAR